MKKIVAIALALVLTIGVFTVSSLAADAKVIEITVDGVPTLLLPSEGAKIVDEVDGDKTIVALAPQDNIDLTATEDFDEEKTQIYEDMLDTADKRDICDNIEEVVKAIDPAGKVSDYEVWDTFDFGMSGEVAKLFRENEGRYIELSFECDVSKDEPVVVMVYHNDEWIALDETQYDIENGRINIRLNMEGIVVLLRKFDGSVSSSVVRPSIQVKDVPGVVNENEEDEFPIYDNESSSGVIWAIPADEIVLTSAANLEGESRVAYMRLAQTKTISDLCPGLMDVVNKIDPAVVEEDLVIKDVFEFKLTGESEKSLDEEDDNNVVLNFKYTIKKGDFFMVMEFIDGKWVALEPDFYWTADDQVGVRLCDDGLLAFIVKAE